MNHGKHVIPKEDSMSVNLLPKIFGTKNKSEYNNGFCLNLPAVSVSLNMSDAIGYLHRTSQTWRNL
jgi:hypothetical protein